MKINTFDNTITASQAAARKAALILKKSIQDKGKAVFVVATGVSQFEFLKALVQDSSIDWSKTEMFHLDEYVGISDKHPASFRKYLKERFISKIGDVKKINLIAGDRDDPERECQRLNKLLADKVVDIAFVGVGENSHLAFNDPPADFDIEDPYIIVNLDKKCRQQQVNEGWFDTINQVPEKAISMSVKQIMKSNNIICTIPGLRKALAVKNSFQGNNVTPDYPASILKESDAAFIFLDKDSASLL